MNLPPFDIMDALYRAELSTTLDSEALADVIGVLKAPPSLKTQTLRVSSLPPAPVIEIDPNRPYFDREEVWAPTEVIEWEIVLAELQSLSSDQSQDKHRLSALYRCVRLLCLALQEELREERLALYKSRIRWVGEEALLSSYDHSLDQHVKHDPLLGEGDTTHPKSRIDFKEWNDRLEGDFCLDPEQVRDLIGQQSPKLLASALHYIFLPTLAWRLHHLKEHLFEHWKTREERLYIGFALYAYMPEGFRAPEEVLRTQFYRQYLGGIARRYVRSPLASVGGVFFRAVGSRLGLTGSIEHFLDILTQEIFQVYISTAQRVTLEVRRAIFALTAIQHPRLHALTLQKLNAQSPTALHERLTRRLCLDLIQAPPQSVQAIEALVSPAQRRLISFMRAPRSPLTQWVQTERWSLLSLALSRPHHTLLGIYLSSALGHPFPLTQGLKAAARQLIHLDLNAFTHHLLYLNLVGWDSVIDERLISELISLNQLEPLCLKLVEVIIHDERSEGRIGDERWTQSLPLTTQVKSRPLKTPKTLKEAIHHALNSKRLSQSLRGQLLLVFQLLACRASEGHSCLGEALGLYRKTRREPERLIRALRLSQTLIQLGVDPLFVFLESETLSEACQSLVVNGRLALAEQLNLTDEMISHLSDEGLETPPPLKAISMTPPPMVPFDEGEDLALSHPVTPVVLSLYPSYAEEPRLLSALQYFYRATLSEKWRTLKYEAPQQESIIDALCLSHPQRYAWSQQNLIWEGERGFIAEEVDAPESIFEASVHPVETCLSWRSGLSCRSLLGFAVDFHQKLSIFKDPHQRVIGRCFWRLSVLHLENEAPMPALVIEPIYAREVTGALYLTALEFALKKATELRVPLFTPLRSYERPHFDERALLLSALDCSIIEGEWTLLLPGSMTGYELSDTLACFDLTYPATVSTRAQLICSLSFLQRYQRGIEGHRTINTSAVGDLK